MSRLRPRLTTPPEASAGVAVLALAAVLAAQDPQPTDPPNPGPQEPSPTQKPDPDPATEGRDPARQKVVVTATRREEDPFSLPFATDTIDQLQLRQRSYRTVPQALRDTPGIMVQETAHGHGSPYIRGFTSFRTVMLVDGIRLNNSVFRSGPNQYWNTIDPWSLDRIEVVKGPSSVLYGSDGVGGTVAVFSRSPWTDADPIDGADGHFTTAVGGRLYTRFADAEDSLQARGEFSIGVRHPGGSHTGVLIGATGKRFGDLEGGADTGLQPETGYEDKAFDIKVEHRLDHRQKLVFLHQSARQDDVPRTHSTVNAVPFAGSTVGSDLVRQLDQHRYLSYVQYTGRELDGPFDTVRANLSWQTQKEERYRVRSSNAEDFSGFDVGTLGAWVNFDTHTDFGIWTYGVDYYLDRVDSFSRRPGQPDAIQGPVADDATYETVGVFAQNQIDLADSVQATVGLRFNYAAADADSALDPATGNRTTLEDDWSDLVGSFRLRWALMPDRLNLFGGVSQGFRAPNLSDLSRLDSNRTGEIETPSPGLDAEEYVQYEVGARYEDRAVSAEATWFYTDISDQILRFPTGAVVAGENEVTKANVGDGYIQGVELGTAWRAVDEVSLFGNLTWMEGRLQNFESPMSALTGDYPTRLMPLTWQTGVRWDDSRGDFWVESAVVHANRQDKLSFSDQRDTSRIPPGGTPGYTLWHVRAGCRVGERATLQVSLENLTDADYRVHGSGLNGPGRNLIVGMEVTF